MGNVYGCSSLNPYGVMLFPNVNDFVDCAAMNAFVGYKSRYENPVTAILTEVYGTLNQCHELKRRKMLCCLPVLYVWFISRVSKGILNATCPVEELLQCKPEIKGANEWAQLCASLSEEKIRWCASWQQGSHIIYHCGNYPNVPLMGIRCCINYNPLLAQRQFGYPMRGSPTLASLATLRIYYEEGTFAEVLHQIRDAWGNIVRAEGDPRSWTVDERIPYNQWLATRVKAVKLPFKLISPDSNVEKRLLNAEVQQAKLLRAELERTKQENITLTNELQNLQQNYANLKHDKMESECVYEEFIRKQKQDLTSINAELRWKSLEWGITEISERVRKYLCDEFKRDKQEALEKLRDIQIKLNDAEQQVEKAVAKLEKERLHHAKSEKRHRELMIQTNEYVVEQGRIIEH